MTYENDPDVIAIKEWMAKENYLPKDFDDLTIKKFLHSCYHSLEKTKKCIEKFTTTRSNMPEIYCSRDPLSEKLKTAFSLGNLATYNAGEDELLCHFLELPDIDKFEYYDILKSFAIQGDYWIKMHECFPNAHVVILDIKYYTLRLVAKANVFHFQKFLIYLLESMPVRLKKIYVINCPSYYEKLFALVKSVLPQDIVDMTSFHSTPEGLHSEINKKYLPEEYGGEAQSLVKQHQDWVKIIKEDRKTLLNDNMWKADLAKKPKTNGIEDSMNGSFRTLSID